MALKSRHSTILVVIKELSVVVLKPMKYQLSHLHTKKQKSEDIELNTVELEDFKGSHSSDNFNSKGFSDKHDGRVVLPFPSQRVSCGLFGITNDHIENYQSLDERFVKNKASTYFFEAESDSMSPLIMEKDILIVDRALDVFSGRIVVCSLNGEMLCKRLKSENGRHFLCSENPNYSPIEILNDSDFSVFGVVRGVAREFTADNSKKREELSFG